MRYGADRLISLARVQHTTTLCALPYSTLLRPSHASAVSAGRRAPAGLQPSKGELEQERTTCTGSRGATAAG